VNKKILSWDDPLGGLTSDGLGANGPKQGPKFIEEGRPLNAAGSPAPGDIRIGAVEVEMGHPATNGGIGKPAKSYEMEEQVTGVPVARPLDKQTPPQGGSQDLQSPDNLQ